MNSPHRGILGPRSHTAEYPEPVTTTASPASDADLADLGRALDQSAENTSFSGVISVDRDGDTVFARAYGPADRRHDVPNTVDTRFGLASIAKGFTALAVMALVEDGVLSLDTRVRDVLGKDLPLIDDAVTVEQLLAHRSGIGDYLDESAGWEVDDYVLPVPVHTLSEPESYLALLDGFPQSFPPGERFSYNNGGFVVLALVANRVSGPGYHDLVRERVLVPAGMDHSGFERSDNLPADAATGYLSVDSDQTNTLHLPVRGVGDGGLYSTVADLSRFWHAFRAGRIVTPSTVAAMVRPRDVVEDEDMRYGLGFWLDMEGTGLILEGYDAGISARSRFEPDTGTTVSVVSNSSEGAWPVLGKYADWLKDRGTAH